MRRSRRPPQTRMLAAESCPDEPGRVRVPRCASIRIFSLVEAAGIRAAGVRQACEPSSAVLAASFVTAIAFMGTSVRPAFFCLVRR